MLLAQLDDSCDHSYCSLTYNEAEAWLQADWSGFVDPQQARRGSEAFLQHAARHTSPYLFNNNELLRGPWFDSLDWLADVWLPLAKPLGLCYVAHVVQADSHSDILSRHLLAPLPFELQIFYQADDARHWLRQQRDTDPDPPRPALPEPQG